MTGNGAPPTGGLAEALMRRLWRKPAATPAERARRRVTLHLIPYLFFLYILAYLDRANVSVAQFGMEASPDQGGLGFTPKIIGTGAGVFFWGYWILEVPSTLSVLKWGARWVFVRILVLWGLACVLVGLINTPFTNALFAWLPWTGARGPVAQFYTFRFLLGFFEGGFFPSVILYLSLWFRPEDRAKAIAGFMAAIPLSSLFGTPLSGLMLHLDWLGLPGWRWIFILQGAAPIVAGIVTVFFLPDGPERASWLPADEREQLVAELQREAQLKQAHGFAGWSGQLGTVLLLTAVYFCLNVSSYGLSMFLPAIIKSQTGLSDVWVTVVAAPFFLTAFLTMLVNGRHSDHTNERIGHVAVPLACLSLSIASVALLDGRGLWPVFVLIFLVGTFMYAHLPAFWPLPTRFLGAAAAAAAIGFINMIGNLGGFVGPLLVGTSAGQSSTVNFASALFKLAPFPLVGALIIVLVGYTRRKQLALPEGAGVQTVDTTETVLVSASLEGPAPPTG